MKILCNNYSIILNGITKKFSSVFIYKSNLTLNFQVSTTLQTGPNREGTECKVCPGDSVYDETAGVCICPEGSRAIEYSDDGVLLEDI